MTREKFINTFTNKSNTLVIGIRTPQSLKHLLYLLTKLGIDHPSSFILDHLRVAFSENKEVGLLLKSGYGDGLQWSYTSNVHMLRDYSIRWFDAVPLDILEGDKL